MNETFFLSPEHLAPVRRLQLRARLIVEGMIAGLHRSPYHGFSAEFSEYRPYQTGESTRMIDWRKYAKTDRSYVRLYEDETNLIAHLLVDKSASMGFSSGKQMTKFDYARTLAASIAWILIRQRDAVALAVFDENVDTYLPPRSTNTQLKNILTTLDGIEPGARTCCGASINRLAHGIKRRGLTVVLSDLYDDPEGIVKGLRHLRFKRQDVLLLWVRDPRERNFTGDSTLRLQDLETGETLLLDGRTAAEYLRDGVANHHKVIERACRELGVDFAVIETDEPFVHALMRVLQTRRRLR
ncbi:MAG: DUF58 domain-containing protein [Chitinispirillaceae bacterium]|nr:DUF58 domain-containing protein [Chitinispirillaceae bacterium]